MDALTTAVACRTLATTGLSPCSLPAPLLPPDGAGDTCPTSTNQFSLPRRRVKRNDDGDATFGPGDYGWGFGTTITLTPQVVTYTLVPTSTELQVSTIVDSQTTYITSTAVRTLTLASSATVIASPPSSTRTSSETLPTTPPPWLTLTTSTSTRPASSTSSSRPAKSTSTTASSASDCQPGEADERVPGLFSPTEEQAWTLIAAAISIVGITIAWNLWGLRWLLYSFKSYTVFVHESGHLLGLLLSGQRLYRFTIDPNTGGATHTVPGTLLRPPSLFLGPLFSLFFGSGLVFAAFDTRAAKYASFVVGVGWVPVVALQGNWVSRVNCALPVGLFIDHAYPLRFYILFIGVMSLFYVVWDTMDDFFHRKQNECCVVMIESNTAVSATLWFGLFFTLSCLAFVGVMLGGLAYWRETGRAMYCEAQAFLPT
uniref:BY PROTMAP: gi/647401474/emb/CDR47737.1/ RHTO0S15e01332g1_1 [Rhodosporidium toruloides] n=1 Tax=Rhodotorula toruloides TaxID=5286 RepID=A0A0K3CH25_RHOTO